MQVCFKNSQGVKANYTGWNVQIFWTDPSRFFPKIANHARIFREDFPKALKKPTIMP